jgi:hypothetical protein
MSADGRRRRRLDRESIVADVTGWLCIVVQIATFVVWAAVVVRCADFVRVGSGSAGSARSGRPHPPRPP